MKTIRIEPRDIVCMEWVAEVAEKPVASWEDRAYREVMPTGVQTLRISINGTRYYAALDSQYPQSTKDGDLIYATDENGNPVEIVLSRLITTKE